MPELTPYEASVYLLLLRNSHLNGSDDSVRIGQRTIGKLCGKGPRATSPSRTQILKVMASLEAKGCIRIGDTNRDGTLYQVFVPNAVPLVAEKLLQPIKDDDDYFNDQSKRNEIYERDRWICQYCGEKVSEDNITLDHFIPQSKGGSHGKENLRTACLICNSIKSGKSYEEAAIYLLQSIQTRKKKNSE